MSSRSPEARRRQLYISSANDSRPVFVSPLSITPGARAKARGQISAIEHPRKPWWLFSRRRSGRSQADMHRVPDYAPQNTFSHPIVCCPARLVHYSSDTATISPIPSLYAASHARAVLAMGREIEVDSGRRGRSRSWRRGIPRHRPHTCCTRP
jgi:hypothetical protein